MLGYTEPCIGVYFSILAQYGIIAASQMYCGYFLGNDAELV